MSARRRARTRSAPAPTGARQASWHVHLSALLLVVAGAAVYVNGLSNPLVMDDRRAIVENQTIRTLWPLSVPLSPPDDTPMARRPVVNVSFAVNYALHGLDVRGYHAGNLLIHLCAGLVLFGLIRRALTLPALRTSFGARADELAAAAAILWTLHPLHTEIINYVTQRTQALMGLCYLLTLYGSVRAVEDPRRWRLLAVASCAVGMACKESMVTAPVLVALFDRALVFGSWHEAWRRRSRLYVGLASTWLLLWALMVSGARTSVGFDGGIGGWTYLLNQAPLLTSYLRLVVWPAALVADYGPARHVTLADVIGPALLIGALGIGCLLAWWRRPHAAFLPLACFVLLAPTSSVVPIVTEAGAERRMYLPAAALVCLAVCAAYRAGVAMRGWSHHATLSRRVVPGGRAAVGLIAAACVAFAVLVVERNREFASPLGLAQTSLERRPHGRSHLSVGNELLAIGRREEALMHFRQASQDFPAARYALGTELLTDGDLDSGIRELREFVARLPDHANVSAARHMIATALALQRRYEDAAHELRWLLDETGGSPELHAQMGEVLLRGNGDVRAAVAHLERAVALRPADPRFRNLLGNALTITGRLEEARRHFLAASALDPGYEAAQASLRRLEQMTGHATP